jgi:Asp-tRNA(Asn)/Glu-tRNA(Gln) amidotransferase A subunit family amidase
VARPAKTIRPSGDAYTLSGVDQPAAGFTPLETLVESLRAGRVRVTEYIAQVYDRIQRVDRQIHAFVPERRRLSRLQAEASAVEARWPDSTDRPPLFGVAVGVKDLFRVDPLPTHAGSRLPPRLFAGREAPVVSVLRSAGAVIAGKTAMDEFAYCEPPLTRNPHNLAHTPGGSSGGSAAAVAAGLCALALGTQTSRSIIGPAAFCGVVGFKPSYGRIPVEGAIPMAPSFDTVGFFTQNVSGALLAAPVLIPDWRVLPPHRSPVLGVPKGLFMSWTLEDGRHNFELQVDQLVRAGYDIRPIQLFADDDLLEMDRRAMDLLHGEMARVHSPWFARYEAQYRPRTARAIRRGQAITDQQLAACRTGQLPFRQQIHELMHNTGVDLWITPASAGPAPHGYDQTGWGGMTTTWSYAGLPCITIPAGLSDSRLPLGLQCVGTFNNDELLLPWAAELAKHFAADLKPSPTRK